MSKIADYTHNLSQRMSKVMDEIGVNEKILIKRRKLLLLNESIVTLTHHLMDSDINTYFFGSQTEGTTTPGLKSDTDCLFTDNRYNVIQGWSEWEHGKHNLLMVQDETVSPGYCLLQLLRDDAPLPAVKEFGERSCRDRMGRILLKNLHFHSNMNNRMVRHGPAHSENDLPGVNDCDYVISYSCQSIPEQARQWLHQHREASWPSYDMRQYCSSTGCFVVAVGNKGSANEELEWRISTSLTERCLMFNLNLTHIRCYVLMKMILKTYITPRFPESISSFMCKTVLLHCVSNTRADEWKDNTLLKCLTFCLSTIYNCVLNEYCPHLIIKENNLMLNRFSPEIKPLILDTLLYVIESNGRALLEIECDSFGSSLKTCTSGLVGPEHFLPSLMAGQIVKETPLIISFSNKEVILKANSFSFRKSIQMLSSIMSNLLNGYHTHMDRIARCLMAQHLCHTMGSVLASFNIYHRGTLTRETFSLMSLGLNSDAASGKLKLASVFYCIGDLERTELILKNIEECYDNSVIEAICQCYLFKNDQRREKFNRLCYESNQEHTLGKHITASCLRFLRCEANCCPYELRYEMFRSTQEDALYKDKDMAVVDSLPFLYFLQYNTYSRLEKVEEKTKALSNLVKAIEEEPNLGHRETALNLLGQCFEKENRNDNALKSYIISLKLRGRNNAAKCIICRLLHTIIISRER